MQIDFLSIGDTTTDAFLDLQTAQVINSQPQKICMEFGAKLPYKKLDILHGVGNAANAAVAASRLGLKAGIQTDVGDDLRGASAISNWQQELVDTSLVKKHKDLPTNYHLVLRYEAERTILIKHENYPYEFMQPTHPPKLVYLTSIGPQCNNYCKQIVEYVKANDVLLVFQPGTFQIQAPLTELEFIYQNTFLFIANKQEVQQILNTTTNDIKSLLQQISNLGPTYTIITDGPNGVYAYDKTNFMHLPMYPDPSPPKDRTGAGDAFSSTIATMMLKGKNFAEAIVYGPINSMNVVQHVGAQEGLLSTTKIERLLQNAPADYKLKLI